MFIITQSSFQSTLKFSLRYNIGPYLTRWVCAPRGTVSVPFFLSAVSFSQFHEWKGYTKMLHVSWRAANGMGLGARGSSLRHPYFSGPSASYPDHSSFKFHGYGHSHVALKTLLSLIDQNNVFVSTVMNEIISWIIQTFISYKELLVLYGSL